MSKIKAFLRKLIRFLVEPINIDSRIFWAALLLVMVLSIVVKIFFLPEVYYLDSYRILKFIEKDYSRIDNKSFWLAAQVFKPLYLFLGCKTILSMSVVLSVCGNLILAILYKNMRIENLISYAFVYLFTGMVNIYAFLPQKEFLQWLINLLMFVVISADCKLLVRNEAKVLGVFSIALLEGVLFREVYLIISLLFLLLFLIYSISIRNIINNLAVEVALLFVGAIISLYLLRIIWPSMYEILANERYLITFYRNINEEGNHSLLLDVFQNKNPFVFSINIFINTVRILFPIELLKRNPFKVFYYLNVVAMLFFLIKMVEIRKKSIDVIKERITYIYLISFLFVSAIYEPDFGSVSRHFSVLLPFICVDFIRTNKGDS